MPDPRGRIVVRNDLIVCSIHGDDTEAETWFIDDRPIHTRWTCIVCGASRAWSADRERPGS